MPPSIATTTTQPVAADMSARALAFYALLASFSRSSQTFGSDKVTCARDGLYADYDTDCREYIKCFGGELIRRYTCNPGRAFSEADGACVPRSRQPCVRRICTLNDTLAYATPGSACRHYYRCENGTAVDHACTSGSWFDLDRQACARGAGTCYEPLCAGLPDGSYPDSSHECRRVLECQGARLRGVKSYIDDFRIDSCPPPRSAAIPLPAGDADFCSDEACSSLCQHAKDGAYADRSTGCREYFVCDSRRVVRRGVCEPGHLFSNGGCESADRAYCPPPARSPCFNRQDGLHRDWRNCSSWYECRRERVIFRGSCDPGMLFDGVKCVTATMFTCDGPEQAEECEGLPSGMYQDLESNCTRYYHCEGSLRTMLSCPFGQVFDGARCKPSTKYLCPTFERDSCYGRTDGRYRALNTGCRGYYVCINGEKTVHACEPGRVFDGESCVPARPGLCTAEDYTCSSLADGYHAEIESNCRRYFYCEGGDRLATLTCLGGKIFDGRTCVEPSQHECGAPPKDMIENDNCKRDGFYVQQGTECKKYYFCVTGTRTSLTCPVDQVFNGQICVPSFQFTCPG